MNTLKLNTNDGIDQFKMSMAFNSYFIRKEDEFLLFAFVFRDTLGSVLHSASFSCFFKELKLSVDEYARYLERIGKDINIESYKVKLEHFDVRNLIDINRMNFASNVDGLSEIMLTNFSHCVASDKLKKINLGHNKIEEIKPDRIALLRSATYVHASFIKDLLEFLLDS